MSFASIVTISNRAVVQGKRCYKKGKGRKGARGDTALAGADTKSYTPEKLPLFRESHIKAMVVGLEATNAILPSPLCANPILPLVATLAVFKAMLDSNCMVPKEKEQVTKVADYLVKWLAIIAMLVDKSMPTVVALYDAFLCNERARQRRPKKTLLFDIAYKLAHRIPLTKLVEVYRDICLPLAALIVAILAQVRL